LTKITVGLLLKKIDYRNNEEFFMLSAKRLGLAGGILWGLVVFIMTLLNIFIGYGTGWISLLADIYPGYGASYFGSVLGLVYGFFDGFIGLFLLAWLYNKISD
jgi:hypothetical protein